MLVPLGHSLLVELHLLFEVLRHPLLSLPLRLLNQFEFLLPLSRLQLLPLPGLSLLLLPAFLRECSHGVLYRFLECCVLAPDLRRSLLLELRHRRLVLGQSLLALCYCLSYLRLAVCVLRHGGGVLLTQSLQLRLQLHEI